MSGSFGGLLKVPTSGPGVTAFISLYCDKKLCGLEKVVGLILIALNYAI